MDEHKEPVGSYPNEFKGTGAMILRLTDSANPSVTHMVKRVRNITLNGDKTLVHLFDNASNDWVWIEVETSRVQGVNAT